MKFKYFLVLFIIAMLFLSSGCGSSSSSSGSGTSGNETISEENTGNNDSTEGETETNTNTENGNTGTDTDTDDNTSTGTAPNVSDITVEHTASATASGTHALEADGTTAAYSNYRIVKTGSPTTASSIKANTPPSSNGGSSNNSDNYDFYGTNAAVLASNSGTLTLTDSIVSTDGAYANAVFAYGATVNVKNCVIITSSRNSGGIMTTGGGTMNATNLRVTTSGGSSAPIRSDRGGGTVTVNGGVYTASGTGSPAIYSTADITVSNADLIAKASQGVVIEGSNSVTLNNCEVSASHTTLNGSQTTRKQAVMIYQSGSGDASEGKGTFTMKNGSITNSQGDIFYVTNTTADITINDIDITNNSTDIFLRAESAGWGSSGSNGGKANLYANDQTIDGDIIVDSSSAVNMYLAEGSAFSGTVNGDNSGGNVYVSVAGESKWTLTGNSYVTALTCGTDSINLNSYTLYVNGTAYTSGTSSTGTAISF